MQARLNVWMDGILTLSPWSMQDPAVVEPCCPVFFFFLAFFRLVSSDLLPN
jgi:hypothetical protein